MKNYLRAIKEILTSTINLSFWVVDALFFILGVWNSKYAFSPLVYILIFLIGYIFSTVNLVVRKNKAIQTNPAIALYFRSAGTRKKLRIRNIWNKPIKDIFFEKISLGSDLFEAKFQLEGTNVLVPNEERTVTIKNMDQEKEKMILAALNPDYQTKANFKLNIQFKDFAGNKFQTIFSLGKDGVSVESK